MATSKILDEPIAKFKKFEINLLKYNEKGEFLNPRIAVIGKSGSGKSWFVREAFYQLHDIPCGTVIAPTDKLNGFYNGFIGKSCIYHEYSPDIIPRILTRQKIVLEENEKRIEKGKSPIDPRAYLIMDDCMSSKHLWIKDPNILRIFNEGRHLQLTFILTMQYSLGISPELRTNFDFVFLLGDDICSDRKRLYEHYAGQFPNLNAFEQTFMQMTANYGIMVLNNRVRSMDLYEKIFWYKAKKTPKFIVGSKKFIEWNEENFDKEYDKKEILLDWGTLGVNKRRQNIKIRLV